MTSSALPDVQVEVAVRGNINKERATFLQNKVFEAVGEAVAEEAATLRAALSGNSTYDNTLDMKLFEIEVSVEVDRRLSEQFLKFIVDNALKEVLGDLGREWMMESIENVTDVVTGMMDRAMDTFDKTWNTVTQGFSRVLDSATQALNKKDDV